MLQSRQVEVERWERSKVREERKSGSQTRAVIQSLTIQVSGIVVHLTQPPMQEVGGSMPVHPSSVDST